MTGADSVRKSPLTFPVRASYRSEIEAMLYHIAFMPSKVALLVQNDKFGLPLASFIEERVAKEYTGAHRFNQRLGDAAKAKASQGDHLPIAEDVCDGDFGIGIGLVQALPTQFTCSSRLAWVSRSRRAHSHALGTVDSLPTPNCFISSVVVSM